MKEYELRNGGFPTAATREANFATTTLPLAAQSTSRSGRVKCTKDKCVGFQHKPEECFSKPQNFKKRDAWITKKEAESGNHSYQPKASQISGMKDVYDPVASFTENNLEYFSFNSEFIEDATQEDSESACELLMDLSEEHNSRSTYRCPSIFGSDVCASNVQ